jgi:hypothetical protein
MLIKPAQQKRNFLFYLYDFLRELEFKCAFVLDRMGLKGSDSGKIQESDLQIKR